jgi:hypothetical protein
MVDRVVHDVEIEVPVMGRWLTTALLCAASMLGSALLAGQGFRPDPIPAESASAAECVSLADGQARQDCLNRPDWER